MNLLEHYARLKNFVDERIQEDIYPEPISTLHTEISEKMIDRLNKQINLSGKKILDCGCGQGVALKIFNNLGAKPTGITFGEDYEVCKKNGYDVYQMDQSFLDFPKGTFDVIWCRHALEHSLFPMFTLRGFFDALKDGGFLYVEVPAPDTSAKHETNKNHYSCFTKNAWISLFQRSGFSISDQLDISFKIPVGDDIYHAFLLKK